MIEPRLTSEFRISALRRRADAEGAVVTILRRGDATSGGIIVIGRVRGSSPRLFEPMPDMHGQIGWISDDAASGDAEIDQRCAKRIGRDPDLWLIELDVASNERLAPLLGTLS